MTDRSTVASASDTERARLEALRSYAILDTPPEREFDDIVRLAAQVTGSPISIISLIDEARQWFKAKTGLSASETPRDVAFCDHAIRQGDVFVVEDALRDDRFKNNPLVRNDPKIRLYAGAPLTTLEGHRLGTLCVIDRSPRRLNSSQLDLLRNLAAQVMDRLEARRAVLALRESVRGLEAEVRRRQEAEEGLRASQNRILVQANTLAKLALRPESGSGDVGASTRALTEAAADTLGVERVGIWLFNADHSVIRCVDLFERSRRTHSSGIEVAGADYPKYFAALAKERHIAADDALSDASTCELAEYYLKPFGITSMLDIPIRAGKGCIGVVCHEHTGPARKWKLDERNFASSIGDLAAVALQAREREELERQLRQAQKMEAMGRLTAGIAHDFNNILTVITGYSELLSGRFAQNDPLKDRMDEIQKAGRRAANLIRQLMAFSRKQVLETRVVDLNDILRDLGKLLPRVLGADVEMSIEPGEDLACVRVDPGQMEQVIINMAVNARDAMPHGGSLKLATQNLTLSEPRGEVQAGHYVLLTITDTGSGMDAETMSQIFEPFFTTKGEGKGTGLGLATSYGIVRQSGGDIRVKSRVGEGTKFSIILPAVSGGADKERGTDVRRLPETRGTETILIAEDDPTIRFMLREVLRGCGYTALEAPDGVKAKEVFELNDGEVDLLITDTVMPRMQGPELIHHLRSGKPSLGVLVISGDAGPEIQTEDGAKEQVARLQKPFAPRELLGKVREILDAGRAT